MSFDISKLNQKIDLSGGEWIDDIPDHPGLRLKVRSARYKPYRVALSAFYRANNKSIQTDEGFVDAQAQTGPLLAEHLLDLIERERLDVGLAQAQGLERVERRDEVVPVRCLV